MRMRHGVSSVLFCLAASLAQATPPAAALPAGWIPLPQTTTATRYHLGWREAAGPSAGPFRFDDGQRRWAGTSPPSAMDQAAVMGTGHAWSDGRPPLDCARTPMVARCH